MYRKRDVKKRTLTHREKKPFNVHLTVTFVQMTGCQMNVWAFIDYTTMESAICDVITKSIIIYKLWLI